MTNRLGSLGPLSQWLSLMLMLMGSLATLAAQTPQEPAAHSPLAQQLQQRIEQWRTALPDIHESAQLAADSVLAGGKLYVVGYYGGWAHQGTKSPATSRLALMQELELNDEFWPQDVLLVTLYGWEDARHLARLADMFEVAQGAGSKVLVLSGAERMKLTGINRTVRLLPDKPFDRNRHDQPANASQAITWAAVATAGNRMALASWIQAFRAACVQRGQLPRMAMPDSTTPQPPLLTKVDPKSPDFANADAWAEQALDKARAELERILREDQAKLNEIAQAMRDARKQKQKVVIARRNVPMLEDDLVSPAQGNWFSFMPGTKPRSGEPATAPSVAPPSIGLWFQGVEDSQVQPESLKPACDRWIILPVRDDLPGIPQAIFWMLIEKAAGEQP